MRVLWNKAQCLVHVEQWDNTIYLFVYLCICVGVGVGISVCVCVLSNKVQGLLYFEIYEALVSGTKQCMYVWVCVSMYACVCVCGGRVV